MNPFSKDYKSGIDLTEIDKNNQRSKSVSKHVAQRRKDNPFFGTLYGIGELVIDQNIDAKEGKRWIKKH